MLKCDVFKAKIGAQIHLELSYFSKNFFFNFQELLGLRQTPIFLLPIPVTLQENRAQKLQLRPTIKMAIKKNALLTNHNIGVARIIDWGGGGGKPQVTCNAIIRNFRKSNFLCDKVIVGWNLRSRGLRVNT